MAGSDIAPPSTASPVQPVRNRLPILGRVAITHLQLFSLPVADQDRSREFYVDVLGFDLVRDNPMGPGQRWVQVAPKGARTSITLVTWFPAMPPGSVKGNGIVLQATSVAA